MSLSPVNFRVKCGRGNEITDKKFWRDHYDVFVVVFSLVIYERSGEEVCSGVCFAWGVFHFIPIIFQDRVPPC